MKKELNVLVTAAGTQTMPGLADCFHFNGERRIRVIGADAVVDPSLKQVVDICCQVPYYDSPDYLECILDLCRRESVNIFFPFMDEELELIHNNLEKFESLGVKVAIPSEDVIRITNDKLFFYQWLRNHHLPVPEFYEIDTVESIEDVCQKLGYPEKGVCIKTRFASGSRGVRILDEKADLYDIFLNRKPNSMVTNLGAFLDMCRKTNSFAGLMAMEYLPGAECSVDLLAENGKILYMAGRGEEDVYASTPQSCKLMSIPKAYQIAEAVIQELRLDGNADLDFKYNEKGDPVLMEINPRIAATMSVIAIGGINLPYLRIKQLLGEKLPKLEPHYGVRMTRRYIDMFTDEQGENLFWENTEV
ncbi:MAG: ATP-grasp domain-containing protein [Lachnospiraceae bacterium]|nr:ATP-grasp domain-containing protein [Lachnospiraceae bacterium]